MLLSNILLAFAWAALQGALTPANLMTGSVLGYAVLVLLTRGGVLERRYGGKVWTFLGLFAYLVYELVLANVRLTRDIIGGRLAMRPGVIRVPLDVCSDGEILMLTALINLTPGSVALDVSADRRWLYVHVMHIESPDAARREIKEGFERRVLQLMR
jgi:multicomponent Na+:H+ antiporter subunit E